MTNINDVVERDDNSNTLNTEYDDYIKLDVEQVFKEGYRFQFELEDVAIECWGSALTGKEIVYIDGESVSEQRSIFSRQSLHKFQHNGDSYEVEYNVVKMMGGEVHCILIKNGVHVETKRLIMDTTVNKKPFNLKTFIKDLLIWGLLGFVCGYIGASLFKHGHLPDEIFQFIDFLDKTLN